MKPGDNLSDRIAAYNEEMLRCFKRGQAAPAEPAAGAPPSPADLYFSPPKPAAVTPTPPPMPMPPPPSPVSAPEPAHTSTPPALSAAARHFTAPPKTERPWEQIAAPTPSVPPPAAASPIPAVSPATPAMAVPTAAPTTPAATFTPLVAPPFGNNAPQEPGSGEAAPMPSAPQGTPNAGMGISMGMGAETDVGYLRVRTSSARGAIPLSGAMVTISHAPSDTEQLLHLLYTDESGFTDTIALPTVSREISLRPGGSYPNSLYIVQVDLPGYYSVRNEDVPVFGGVTSVQEIAMIPLPDPTGKSDTIVNPGANLPYSSL